MAQISLDERLLFGSWAVDGGGLSIYGPPATQPEHVITLGEAEEAYRRRDDWRHYPLRAVHVGQAGVNSPSGALGGSGAHTAAGLRMPAATVSYAKMDFSPSITQATVRLAVALWPNEVDAVYSFQWRNVVVRQDAVRISATTAFAYTNTTDELHVVEFERTENFGTPTDVQKSVWFVRVTAGETATNGIAIMNVDYRTYP